MTPQKTEKGSEDFIGETTHIDAHPKPQLDAGFSVTEA